MALETLFSSRSWLELSRDSLDLEFLGHKVWYDHANKQLVLMKNNVYYVIGLYLGAQLSPPLNFVHAGNALDVKFSLCNKYLAIQRSDTTIEIVDLARATEIKLSCKTKRGNLVLRGGVLWLQKERHSDDATVQTCICLVTRFGLEVYRLPTSDKGEQGCKLLGTVKHTIQCFWHLPEHHVLLLGAGTGQEMKPYQFQGGNLPIKLAKFSLSQIPEPRDVVLTKLYDSIYCLEVDVSSRSMYVYKLGRENSPLVKTLKLFASGSLGVSTVDNIICVHNMEGKFSCMYDILADTDHPCTAPKPIYCAWKSLDEEIPGEGVPEEVVLNESDILDLIPSAEGKCSYYSKTSRVKGGEIERIPCGSALTHVNDVCLEDRPFKEVLDELENTPRPAKLQFKLWRQRTSDYEDTDAIMYSSSWVFLDPYWILDAKRGHIWKMELNFDSIPDFIRPKEDGQGNGRGEVEPSFVLRDPRRLYSFLLRRACSQPLTSKMVFVHGPSKKDERAYAKAVLLKYLRLLVSKPDVDVNTVAIAFKLINDAYLKALHERASNPAPQNTNTHTTTPGIGLSPVRAAKTKNEQQNTATLGKTSPGKEEHSKHPHLDQLLKGFQSAGLIALKDIRCYNGLQVVLQIDIFTWLFIPSIPENPTSEKGKETCRRLAAFLTEYVRSLQFHFIPIEKYIHELLAWLYIHAEQEYVLHQLLKYHVPTDSRRLALTLVEASSRFPLFLQVALDMLYRLGAQDLVVKALLEKRRLLEALRILQRHPQFLQTGGDGANAESGKIRSKLLFDCAFAICSEQGNPAMFIALHSFFVSMDPWIITPESPSLRSPLAKEVGTFDAGAFDDETTSRLASCFGFHRTH
mmetsp:Transcript_2428/g.3511  ORF Transcript_2428/g.3511 Transcript_2428/m.3511 type:complete len:857 (+) Transcript_2428:479-3049(+)